jgi:phosphatidylserine/phosphatidylglycerophosphate/cardiolipin synthase-like enzyme
VTDSYTPEERRQAGPVYLTVGSVNMDYRSMVMDGEAMVITTGWSTFEGLLDFIILPGLCEWIDDIDRLDELFPPPSGFGRWMGNFMKLAM